jgi:hypothetical protein
MMPIDDDERAVLRFAARLHTPISWYQVERSLFPLGRPGHQILEALAAQGFLRLEREEPPMRWYSITEKGSAVLSNGSKPAPGQPDQGG